MSTWQDEHFMAGVRDFAAGTLSGVAGVVAGHPLDTIRIRMQLSKVGSAVSTKDVYQNMVSSEGSLSLFKGMVSPMAGVGLLSAMLFYAYGQIQMVQRRFHPEETLFDVFVAGTGAGIFQTLLLAPLDNVKIRLQAQTNQRFFTGPLHCLTWLYQSHGIRGLYKGMYATLLRDSFSYGVYFAAYEFTKQRMVKFKNSSREIPAPVIGEILHIEQIEASPLDMFLAGGIAGVVSWLVIYPVDVVKSRIQEDSFKNPKYNGMIDCFKKSVASDGWRSLLRGLSPTLLRTFIVSGANFLVYEMVSKSLS